MRSPIDIIAWTGWAKEDYEEFSVEALIFLLRYGVAILCIVFAIALFCIMGPSIGFLALLAAMAAITIACIKFGEDIEETKNARDSRRGEKSNGGFKDFKQGIRKQEFSGRSSKPSKALYFSNRSGVNRGHQGIHPESSGVRSSCYSECLEILDALGEQKRHTRPRESQVVFR